MTISRHGFSSIKLENSYTLGTKKEKKKNNNNSSDAGRSCNCNGNDRNTFKWMIEIMMVIGRNWTIDNNNNNSNSSNAKAIVKTYQVMRKIPMTKHLKYLIYMKYPIGL